MMPSFIMARRISGSHRNTHSDIGCVCFRARNDSFIGNSEAPT